MYLVKWWLSKCIRPKSRSCHWCRYHLTWVYLIFHKMVKMYRIQRVLQYYAVRKKFSNCVYHVAKTSPNFLVSMWNQDLFLMILKYFIYGFWGIYSIFPKGMTQSDCAAGRGIGTWSCKIQICILVLIFITCALGQFVHFPISQFL